MANEKNNDMLKLDFEMLDDVAGGAVTAVESCGEFDGAECSSRNDQGVLITEGLAYRNEMQQKYGTSTFSVLWEKMTVDEKFKLIKDAEKRNKRRSR